MKKTKRMNKRWLITRLGRIERPTGMRELAERIKKELFLVNIFINPLMAEKEAKTDGFPNKIDMRSQRE